MFSSPLLQARCRHVCPSSYPHTFVTNYHILLTFCVSTLVPASMKSLTRSLSPFLDAMWMAQSPAAPFPVFSCSYKSRKIINEIFPKVVDAKRTQDTDPTG